MNAELENALELILDDLTESNAHTIAALLSAHYRNTLDQTKYLAAYKAAQLAIFGTQ